MTDPNCGPDPRGVDIGLGIFLVVGTIAAYIPQEMTFIKTKTNEGVSLLATLFGNITNFSTILNAFVQNWSLLTKCSSVIRTNQHVPDSNPVLTTFIAVRMGVLHSIIASRAVSDCFNAHVLDIYFLFLVFFRKNAAMQFKFFSIMGFVSFTLFYLVGGVFTFLFLLHTVGPEADVVVILNKIIGISAAALVTMQYVPQIFATCRLKKAGSLSLLTLTITASGSFLTAFFLGFSYSQGWLIWLPNVVAGVQQFIVLFLCLMYKLRERRKVVALIVDKTTTPLLKEPVNH